MKFWEKVYLMVMILFFVVLNICNILVFQGGYRKSVESVQKSCISQWSNVAAPFTEDLAETGEDAGEEWELFQTYVSAYATETLAFELWRGDELRAKSLIGTQRTFSASEEELESDFLMEEERGKILKKETRQIQILKKGKEKYSCTSGFLTGTDYHLVIYGRVTDVLNIWKGQLSFFIILEISASIVMAVLLYFLMRRFLRPVSDISEAAAKIAAGDYQHQLMVKGEDELAKLAEDMNQMAEQVRINMEDKDREAQTKQEFIDALSHELRTPLTSIQGYAQLLRSARLSEDKNLQYLDHILQESGRVIGITETLRQVILLRQEEVRMEEILLSKLGETMSGMAEIQFQERQIDFQIEVKGEKIVGNEVLVELFFTNLIRNSYHACEEGGVIRMELSEEKAIIEDNGIGMTEECQKHVFEPFYREDKARSRAVGGTGLGMYLCRQIADIHGWKLNIMSEKGKGTKITTLLQVSEDSIKSRRYSNVCKVQGAQLNGYSQPAVAGKKGE